MKTHTRVLGVLMAGMMAVSTMAMVPANAANTDDRGWNFNFSGNIFDSHKYSYWHEFREKRDASSVYVYFKGGSSSNMYLQTMGRRNGGGWNNHTLAGYVYLARGNQYSIQNNIFEALKLKDKDYVETALRANANGWNDTVDTNGVWSPDSVGTYTVV